MFLPVDSALAELRVNIREIAVRRCIVPAILYHNLLPPHRRSVWEREQSYGSRPLIPSRLLAPSVWLGRTQEWGTEEKSKVCVHSGFNDVCVCAGEEAGRLSTRSSCGGRSYECNRRPHTEWAEQRVVSYNWRASELLFVPFMRFHLFHILLSILLSPPFLFLGFSHIFLSFWRAGAVKYVCRGGSLGNCLKITGRRVANVPWRSASCAKDSVIKNKLKSQIHMWSRRIHR